MENIIEFGDNREIMKRWATSGIKVHTCVTSPPYYGLRDYGTGTWVGGDPNCDHVERISEHGGERADRDQTSQIFQYKDVCGKCGAVREDKQLGLEETPEEYIANMVDVFRHVRDILADDGTLWINIGDSYSGSPRGNKGDWSTSGLNGASTSKTYQETLNAGTSKTINKSKLPGIKPKDLIGIPWMLAFALRADGWYLRQDIIWCLSGGTMVYVKSQKGIMPMSIKDLTRLNPSTVQLWTGTTWTNVLGWGRSTDREQKLELVLRSGERIGCTGGHLWPTANGNVKAKDLKIGDVIETCVLPEPENTIMPQYLTNDLLWLIGLFLAEGSRSDDTLQLALNSDEIHWLPKIQNAVSHVGGTVTHTVSGNCLNVRMYGKVINAVISEYISGRTAKNKHLTNKVWMMPNSALKFILDGYFDGDGHYDVDNNRIRLGFCRNYYLEQNLRTAASRLGATITLNLSTSKMNGKPFPSFRGEWRWERGGHHNNKNRGEIVEIRRSHGREFWDISVEDDSHLFSLASGVLTHNCKPNPMPESVKDRCTKAHEYIFLLSKSDRYNFDHVAIMEPVTASTVQRLNQPTLEYQEGSERVPGKTNGNMKAVGRTDLRNKRSVWTVNTKPYKGAHFATYPEELITPCVLAGAPFGGIVFDPFMGSGTTAAVAIKHGRKYLGCELNLDYKPLQEQRLIEASNNKPAIFEDDSESLFNFE